MWSLVLGLASLPAGNVVMIDNPFMSLLDQAEAVVGFAPSPPGMPLGVGIVDFPLKLGGELWTDALLNQLPKALTVVLDLHDPSQAAR